MKDSKLYMVNCFSFRLIELFVQDFCSHLPDNEHKGRSLNPIILSLGSLASEGKGEGRSCLPLPGVLTSYNISPVVLRICE